MAQHYRPPAGNVAVLYQPAGPACRDTQLSKRLRSPSMAAIDCPQWAAASPSRSRDGSARDLYRPGVPAGVVTFQVSDRSSWMDESSSWMVPRSREDKGLVLTRSH